MIAYTTTIKNEADLRGIYALQKANLKKNLTDQEIERDGFVTVDHDWKTLEKLNVAEPHIIAKDANEVIGYVLAMPKEAKFDIPILFPMFDEFDKIMYNGQLISDYDYMIVGQVCVHKNYRGMGVFENCFRIYKKEFANRYDFTITEIALINQRSRKAHKKVGFKEIHTYKDLNQTEWVIVVWDWKYPSQNG